MKTLDQLGTNILQVSNIVALASNQLTLVTNRLVQLSNEVSQISSTLSRAEARYPISDYGTNLTLPGSYYLTTNLVMTDTGLTFPGDGINIRTNVGNVSIDLNGFSIISTNLPGAASPVGVRISAATNIVVKNGQITGFDRGVRAEGLCYGIVIDNLHVHLCKRAGIEANNTGGPTGAETITVRNCVIEDMDSTGEATSVSADGITMLNCTFVVDSCVIHDIFGAGTGVGTCIDTLTCTNSFVNNCFMANADFGIKVTGGGTNRVFYRNNLTGSCTTPFSVSGGVDRGGNF
jgi:hypothetical protein